MPERMHDYCAAVVLIYIVSLVPGSSQVFWARGSKESVQPVAEQLTMEFNFSAGREIKDISVF